eukprot:2432217-Amphidinium_carterae.1
MTTSPTPSRLTALTDGHRQVQMADRLLRRSWIFPAPLPVVGAPPEAAAEAEQGEEPARFCELVVVAVYWNSGSQPDDAPTGLLVAVPEVAAHGVENTTITVTAAYRADGSYVDQTRVALVLANPSYIAQHLTEGCPADATLISFIDDMVGALPWNAALFAGIELPETALQGFWLHVAEEEQPLLRMLVDGTASDEDFRSAAGADTDDVQTLMTEIVGSVTTTRRVSQRSRRPSVLGLGSSAKAMGSFLSRPKSTPVPAKPKGARAKVSAVPKGSSPEPLHSLSDRDILAQVLTGVQALGERVSALEAPHGASPWSHPNSSMPMPLPMSPLPMPPSSTMLSAPLRSPPLPLPSSPTTMPLQSSPMSMPMAPSPALPMSSTWGGGPGIVGCAGALPKSPPSVLEPPPGASCSSTPYLDAMAEARRLLALPDAATQPPQVQTHHRGARERQVDMDIRAAVMRGGPDCQTAVNLALVEALERLSGRGSGGEIDDGFAEFLGGGDGVPSDGERKTRGAEQLVKLARSIEQSPEKFSAQLDIAAAKACGALHTNLPWTMELYAERNIKFGKLEGHERIFSMLAHLHGLARSGQHALLAARIGQFLKSTELAVQCGGAWKLAWLLTGLPEVRSQSASMLGRGLGMPAEYAATVSYLKDLHTLETAILKVDDTHGGHGGPAQSSSTNTSTSTSHQQNQSQQGQGKGAGRTGRGGRDRAKPKAEGASEQK